MTRLDMNSEDTCAELVGWIDSVGQTLLFAAVAFGADWSLRTVDAFIDYCWQKCPYHRKDVMGTGRDRIKTDPFRPPPDPAELRKAPFGPIGTRLGPGFSF